MAKPKTITTNYLIIETAMAAYMVLEDSRLLHGDTLPDGHPYKAAELAITEWCENYGAATMRDQAWQIAPVIESVWRIMSEAERDGDICWDFEFVPEIMLYCFKFNKNSEYLRPTVKDPEQLRDAYRKAREVAKAFQGKPSSRQRDRFFQECREEAEKQWRYADLISDHPDAVQSAFEANEKPAEFVKALGKDLDLIDFGPWS